MLVLAAGVAVVHGLAVLFMLTGALLALRRPGLVLVHAPIALAILAVNLAGADCPLTDRELALREQAGATAYEGGFLGHYLFGPLGLDVDATGPQLGIYATAVGVNALGYGLLARRALRRAPAVVTPVPGPRAPACAATPASSVPCAAGSAAAARSASPAGHVPTRRNGAPGFLRPRA